MHDGPREFGHCEPEANYTLRLGGYSVVYGEDGQIAVVVTKGMFYLPGGGQETGETSETAAIREAREECGLVIQIVERIGVADELVHAADEQTYFRKRCTFFRAEVVDTSSGVTDTDHALQWMPAKQAVTLLRHGSQRWAVSESAG